MEDKIKRLNEIIQESERVAFLGGAGVSTESGIPDFRSKDGLYNKVDDKYKDYQPEYLLSHGCLEKKPELFFEFYREKMDARNIKPNRAHYKLAEMEKRGKLNGVVTQNIDGLHQKAGSEKVWEIHGTMMKAHCMSCDKEFDGDYIFENNDTIPKCPHCGGVIRPDVVLYGEWLPEPAYSMSVLTIGKADCLIIGGTALKVDTAGSLARSYTGKHLIIINKGETPLDERADLVFHDSIGDIMEQIEV